jgi:hypothetical protein
MNIYPVFQPLATVDTCTLEYINFKESLLKIDWKLSEYIKGTHPSLNYAPGFYLDSNPWLNTHTGYKNYHNKYFLSNATPEIETAVEQAKPFLKYLESILNGYKIIRAELMATAPEKIDRKKELARIHIDSKMFHKHALRCQLAIQTNPGALLFVEGESLNVSDSVIYTFNNQKAHWGVNWGDSLKLVLMFDIMKPEDWELLSDKEKKKFFDEHFSFGDHHAFQSYIASFRKLHRV